MKFSRNILFQAVTLFTALSPLTGSAADLTMGDIRFDVMSTRMAYDNTIRIVPHGLERDDQSVSFKADGEVVGEYVTDLDNNGWPEIYMITRSVGSGSYGTVVGYAVNNGKSMSPVYMPELSQQGYMGHDRFEVQKDHISRTFPLYKEDDPNARPSGGEMTIRYQLTAGEAGWILKPQF